MSTIINANIKFIRKQQGMTQQKFADHIGIKRSALGSYEEGRAQPSYDTVLVIAEKFNISTDKLLKEDLADVAGQVVFGDGDAGKRSLLKTMPAITESNHNNPAGSRILAITVDKDNNENIELVPEKAAASYLKGYQDPEYLQELPKFRLPFLPLRPFLAVFLEPMPPMRFIIFVVYKRIENNIDDNSTVICRSDNPAYPPFRLKADDIKEAWHARNFILKEMPNNDVTLEKVMNSVINLQQEVMSIKNKIVH